MIQAKTYVHQTEQGGLRVGDLDVSLDSIVIAYRQGYVARRRRWKRYMARSRLFWRTRTKSINT